MKLVFMIALCLCTASSLSIHAQDLIPQSNDKGKWGYVRDDNNVAIKYIYDQAMPFDTQGLAKVRKGDSWGLINPSGKEVLSIKYDLIETFAPSIYRIAAGGKIKDGVLLDEKYGFANSTGEILLKPEYDEVGQFKNGLAYIYKDGLYGYINDKIEVIIPCKYKAVGTFNNDGYTWVCDGGSFDKENPSRVTGGKIGIYDRTGKVIIPAKYASVGLFTRFKRRDDKKKLEKMGRIRKTVIQESNSHCLYAKSFIRPSKFVELIDGAPGLWMSSKTDGTENGIVNLDGTIVIPEKKYRHAWYPTDGMMMVQIKSGYGQYNFVNLANGTLLLKENAQDCWAFKDGYAVIRRPDIPIKKANANSTHHYSIIDLNGNRVSNLYDEIYPANEGVHIVSNGSKYGLIAQDGHEILGVDNHAIFPPSHGLLARRVDENEPVGFIDTNGQWVIKPQFKNAYSFSHGLAAVKGNDGWGYIDTKSNITVPLKWHSVRFISTTNPEIVFVDPDSDGGSQPMDVATGKLLGNTTYKYIRNFGVDFKDAAIVGTDENNTGIIDRNGKTIIPPLFPFATTRQAYNRYLNTGKKAWTETDTYRTRLINDTRRNKGRINQKLDSTVWDY